MEGSLINILFGQNHHCSILIDLQIDFGISGQEIESRLDQLGQVFILDLHWFSLDPFELDQWHSYHFIISLCLNAEFVIIVSKVKGKSQIF